jgi:predicted RNase H-like HicB family nuclease
MKYKVALRHTKEGYSVWVPGLPGCWSEGATKKEAIENIRIAIAEYLEAVDKVLKGVEISEVEVAR